MTGLSLNVNTKNQITNTGFSYDLSGDTLADGLNAYAYDGESRIKSLNSGAATYFYDADGQRALKTVGTDTTEYINLSGQNLAERKGNGDWSDYIYSNGRILVRADTSDSALVITGTNCLNCGSQYSIFWLSNAGGLNGYTIRAGDKLCVMQYQGPGSEGGVQLQFTDLSSTNWTAKDQDGNYANEDVIQQQLHLRTIDLSAFAGKQVQGASVDADYQTTASSWGISFEQFVLVSSDGSVHPIYTGQASPPGYTLQATSGATGQNMVVQHYSGRGISYPQTNTYYHQDHLGSARLTTTTGGWPNWSGTFLPFGQEWNPQLIVNHYKFTGKERDSESTLDNFGARYYSSSLGRFVSADWSTIPTPVPYANFTNPQTLNLYGYVKNNPLSSTDPDGHCDPGSPGCALQASQAISNFADNPGGYAKSFIVGAVKQELSNIREHLYLAPLEPSNDVERAGAGMMQATVETAAVVLPLVTGGEGEEPGGSFMGPKEGSSGGAGAYKRFKPATQQAAVDENTAANGGPARCVFCGDVVTNEAGPNKVNIDHAESRAKGGDDTLGNANVTCQYCNQSKGTGPAPKNPKPRFQEPQKPQ
jgi:RHS repeat-associated protein